MNFVHINPFKALFYTAVIYGLISPVLIFFILLLANNSEVMGKYKNNLVTNILGVLTLAVMTSAAALFIIVSFI